MKDDSDRSKQGRRGRQDQGAILRLLPSKGPQPEMHGSQGYGTGSREQSFIARSTGKETGGRAAINHPPDPGFGMKLKGLGEISSLEVKPWVKSVSPAVTNQGCFKTHTTAEGA